MLHGPTHPFSPLRSSVVADDGLARAARATQADQASRKYLGFVAQIGIAQHRVQFTATVIEVVARFSLGGILERFDKIAESFEPNGERGVCPGWLHWHRPVRHVQTLNRP